MSKEQVPKTHPRYHSLLLRDRIVEGYQSGITGLNGLIAHGRGETFDYLIDEKTQAFAQEAIEAAAQLLINAKYPVISTNGNSSALCPEEMIALANALGCPLEINIFYSNGKDGRAQRIKKHLENHGAKTVLLPEPECSIGYIQSNRKFVNPDGIKKADVVFVPLEDGDRTQALIQNNIKVITVDLNPLSRTAKDATINIVDNLYRCLPLLTKKIQELKNNHVETSNLGVSVNFDKENNRQEALKKIRSNT